MELGGLGPAPFAAMALADLGADGSILHRGEIATDPHLVARGTIVDVDGAAQPHPAPRFSATPTAPVPAAGPPVSLDEVVQRWGKR